MAEITPCIVCDKPLKEIIENTHQPDNGLMCQAHGNYGSTVFDPVVEISFHLGFNICDECITKAIRQGRVRRVRVRTQQAVTYDQCNESDL